ncbi:hypothetical protein [Verrucosispora sp. NA02020]|nr:hypothetical protein [Verrucosispora sp. NA02020]
MLLLIAAVVFALLRAFGVPARADFGWLAIACVIAAVWLVPAVS